MKVFVVGPIYPYRGGIAHSNRLLCEALSKNHDVTCVSFSRLYPGFLFPGKSQREPEKNKALPFKAEYEIDSINPLSWIRVGKKIRNQKPDWVVFHYWHPAFVPCYWALADLIRQNGHTRLSMLCHNFVPHDALHGLHGFFSRAFAEKMDCLAAFSSAVAADIQGFFPNKPSGWFVEPAYSDVFENDPGITREKARKELGILPGENVLLFFGFVRAYKGLSFLLDALPLVLKKIPVKLVIAGEFWKNKEKYLEQIENNGLGGDVKIVDEYIPDSKTQFFFKAADALVLPYESSTNSAVLKLAFGFKTPVIASALPAHADVLENGKTGILVKPQDSAALARAITGFFSGKKSTFIRKNIQNAQGIFEWCPQKEKILFNTNADRK